MGHIALPLVNGWTAYGGVYGTPDYTVRNGMCSLEGLLYKSGSSPNQQLALLPEDCRPGWRRIWGVVPGRVGAFGWESFRQTSMKKV